MGIKIVEPEGLTQDLLYLMHVKPKYSRYDEIRHELYIACGHRAWYDDVRKLFSRYARGPEIFLWEKYFLVECTEILLTFDLQVK